MALCRGLFILFSSGRSSGEAYLADSYVGVCVFPHVLSIRSSLRLVAVVLFYSVRCFLFLPLSFDNRGAQRWKEQPRSKGQ